MAELQILITARNQAQAVLNQVQSQLNGIAGLAQRGMGGLQNAVGVGLKAAAGIGAVGVGALGAGFGLAVKDGLGLNSTLENVQAQLLAFTKDGDMAARILEEIRKEAAKTPFAFDEMAKATASLLPAAKQSGAELMGLVKQAEILAASNPEQGLEGAAFALREALSGDFTSIIERFNLPRQYLNQLKQEGVPALEAVSMAMSEMGLDSDLVDNMAETMTGRWSTFLDTVDTLKASLSQPLFDLLKTGLTSVQGLLDDNMPRLQEFATLIGERLAGGIRHAVDLVRHFVSGLQDGRDPLHALQTALINVFDGASWLGGVVDAIDAVRKFAAQARETLAPVTNAIAAFVSWKDILTALGIVVASMVLPALAGIVAAAAPVILAAAALVAAVTLVRNAWENDWGGIRTALTTWWTGTGQPIFSQLQAWLGENIPKALSTLSQYWEDHLLPALRQVWQFIETYLVPLFDALANLWIAGIKLQLAALKVVWETVLRPALQALWQFIVERILPAFDSADGKLGGFVRTIQAVTGWVNTLADRVGNLANKLWSLPSSAGRLLGFAGGTGFAPGGMALVGEPGPEMVYLPRGSRVETAERTAAAMGGSGQQVVFAPNIYNNIDLELAFERFLSVLNERGR